MVLGQKYLEEQNYEAAIIAFSKAIAIEPNNIQAYVYALDAYTLSDKHDEMLLFYEDALSVVNILDKEILMQNKEYVVSLYLAVENLYDDLDKIIDVLEQGYNLTGDEQIYNLLVDKIKEKEILEIEKNITETEPSETDIVNNTEEEITENITSAIQEESSDYGTSEEWIDDLANKLIADDYQAVLDILRERDSLREKCAKYELSDWALWDYEKAYSMTASDGTVVGIIFYDHDNGEFRVEAFVSYTPENGFEYTQAGDHHVIYHTDRGWGEWTYLKGQTIYYEKNSDPVDIGEDGIYSIWHM